MLAWLPAMEDLSVISEPQLPFDPQIAIHHRQAPQLPLKGVQASRGPSQLLVSRREVLRFLGAPPLPPLRSLPSGRVGAALGLAWTPVGGEILTVESQRLSGSGGLHLTGQLGEVMRESAQTALSFARAWLRDRGIESQPGEIHVHVPQGAIPKDGPSAGVTVAVALTSLLSGIAVRQGVAMTGELTLTGQVLAIGGVREKVIAARRVGIDELILPEANRGDFDELPEHIRAGITVHFASTYADVAKRLFGKKAEAA